MSRKKRIAREEQPRTGEKRRSRRVERIGALLESYASGEESVEQARARLLPVEEPQTLLACVDALLREERPERGRLRILELAASVLGGGAGPFLRAISVDGRTSLAEKRKAVELLGAVGEAADREISEGLDAAFDLVERASRSRPEDGVEASRGAPSPDLSTRWMELPEILRIAVAGELLARSPSDALSLLRQSLERTGALPEGMLRLLAETGDEEAARVLLAWHERTGSKSIRKEIKRTMHKRRARGLPVLEPEETEPGEPIWKPPVPSRPIGLLSMPDASGSRMICVLRQQIPRGILAFTAWVNDLEGLKEIGLRELSRRESEAYRKSLLEADALMVVETDAGHCAYRIEEAYQKGGPASAEQKDLYRQFRGLLRELIPAEGAVLPIRSVWHESSGEEAGSLADPFREGAQLLGQGPLAEWRIETRRMAPFLTPLEEIQESRIIVHPLQRQERIASFHQETARTVFADPGYREAWKGRIEDAAWILYKKGEEPEAKRLYLIGRYLENPENDPARVPLLVHLVRKTLEGMLGDRKKKEASQPSLIVKPGTRPR
ncbi:MAG: hypothetical protein AB1640_00745 [bacterium]